MMKRLLIFLVCTVILLGTAAVVLAQDGAETGDPLLTGSLPDGDTYTLDLQPQSGAGTLAGDTEFWRLVRIGPGSVASADMAGRPLGPAPAFYSSWGVSNFYYVFPTPAADRQVQAAYFYLLSRTGTYSGQASLSLQVFDADGNLLRVVSESSVDLQAASTGNWIAVDLADYFDDRIVLAGEYLAFRVQLSGGAGGTLAMRPAFEVQVDPYSGPEPEPDADLALSKSVTPATVWPGETVTYTLVYINYGTLAATGVRITDIVPVTLTNTSVITSGAAITPTGSMTYTWEVMEDLGYYEGGVIQIVGQVASDLVESETFTNTATISTSTYDHDLTNNTAEAAVQVDAVPLLSLAKSAFPDDNVPLGGEVRYTVVLSNTGWGEAAGTLLTDTLPAPVDVARWVEYPSGTTWSGGEIYWGGTLAPKAALTWTFDVTHTGDYGDVVTNTVEYDQAGDGGQAEAVFRVVTPQLYLQKLVEPQSGVAYHGEVTYTLVLTNAGPADASGIVLSDVLPSEVDFARWVAKPSGTSVTGDDILWQGVFPVDLDILTWSFVVTHTGDYGDVVTNTASCASAYGSDDASATFEVAGPPALSVDKDVSSRYVEPSGEVTYTLTLNNTGPSDATEILLTDTLPAEVQFQRWVQQPYGTFTDNDVITWTGVLTNGESLLWEFVVSFNITFGDEISNTVYYNYPLGSGSDEAVFLATDDFPVYLPLILKNSSID